MLMVRELSHPLEGLLRHQQLHYFSITNLVINPARYYSASSKTQAEPNGGVVAAPMVHMFKVKTTFLLRVAEKFRRLLHQRGPVGIMGMPN